MSGDRGITLVTGAAGFVGGGLLDALRAGSTQREAVLSTDHVATPGIDIVGDISDVELQARLFTRPIGTLFHMAGIVSGRAEAEFALGKRVNIDATLALLEHCRVQVEAGGPRPVFVMASSIAVFGAPPVVFDDATPPAPRLSYGAQKLAIEVLVDDYTRRGFVDGRCVRLSGVVVRPPAPNGARSAFNSDIFREPFAGRDYECPLPASATIWLTSLGAAVANLMRIAVVPGERLGARRALTAPALPASLGDIAAAIARIDRKARDRLTFARNFDPDLLAQFGSWPLAASFDRGAALGLSVDPDVDTLIWAEQRRGGIASPD